MSSSHQKGKKKKKPKKRQILPLNIEKAKIVYQKGIAKVITRRQAPPTTPHESPRGWGGDADLVKS